MHTLTALEAHEKIAKAAIPDTEIRHFGDEMTIAGKWCHQGDVYFERLSRKPAKLKAIANRQLAPGTTQGARHIVEEGPELFVREGNTDPLVGPVIVSKERFLVNHPEHAALSLPAGVYDCRFQKDENQEERHAVRD
jgi:hypothetical protein